MDYITQTMLSRRQFVKSGIAVGAVLSTGGVDVFADGATKPEVWVVHGDDKKKMMRECLKIIQENGGLGKNVKTLALKVNAAWARSPEEGANTHPDLVAEFIKGCNEAGVKKVLVPEHPCNSAKSSFTKSGILNAVTENEGKMIDLKKNQKSFAKVTLPKAKNLTEAQVADEYLSADAIINIPVAKHHSGSTLSMAMKNWMGVVKDRRFWHKNNLHQCIADFSSFIKPNWTIIDATRTMMDSGPQGPAKTLKHPNLLILSKDQIAADAYASTLFDRTPDSIRYLKIANEMGLGEIDPKKMNIKKINL